MDKILIVGGVLLLVLVKQQMELTLLLQLFRDQKISINFSLLLFMVLKEHQNLLTYKIMIKKLLTNLVLQIVQVKEDAILLMESVLVILDIKELIALKK